MPFWYRFARPGVIAAASNFIFPGKLRAAGAKTVYFDLYMNNRVGTPDRPEDEATVVDWAQRIYYRAAASAGCAHPWMALNELFGAQTTTPWTSNNAQYRHNVIVFAKALKQLGARPFILISARPYTQGEAGLWWREAAAYADLVQETYFSGKLIHRQGPVSGSRTMRNRFREAIRTFTDLGIPAKKLGIMLGFFASNRGSMGAIPWFQHVKLQALAAQAGRARDAARERLVVGLAGAEHGAGRPRQGGGGLHLALGAEPAAVRRPRRRRARTSTPCSTSARSRCHAASAARSATARSPRAPWGSSPG